jgi:hypothetical protein
MAIGSARVRYKIAVSLLAYGLTAIISLLPLSFVLYGHPLGFIGPVLLFSGIAAVALATVLGLYNYVALESGAPRTERKN